MSKRSQRKRAYLRKKGRAYIRRLVDRQEREYLHSVAAAARLYCPILVGAPPAPIPELPAVEAQIVDTRQPCGGRLRAVKRSGAMVPGLFECRRCGRQTLVAAAPPQHDLPTSEEPAGEDTQGAEIAPDTVEAGPKRETQLNAMIREATADPRSLEADEAAYAADDHSDDHDDPREYAV